jgi:hypothetical protein
MAWTRSVRAQGAGPDRTSLCLDELRDAIIELWDGQGRLALGYDSWHNLCMAEGLNLKLRLPMMARRSIVGDLTEHGMSTRAIGSALGVGKSTMQRDLEQCVPNGTPATITGREGKPYPPNRHRIEPQQIGPHTVTISPPQEPTPVRVVGYRTDPVGHVGNIDRVARELLTLLGRADARHDLPERRVLLGDLAAVIEDRREQWVD